MIAKSVPREVRNNPMILVQVVPVVGEYQIRLKLFLQGFEQLLNGLPFIGKASVREIPNHDCGARGRSKEQPGCGKGFPFSLWGRTENNPIEIKPAILLKHAQNRSAAADLDVVAMRAKAEHVTDTAPRAENGELMHAVCRRELAVLRVDRSRCDGSPALGQETPSTLPKEHARTLEDFRAIGGP